MIFEFVIVYQRESGTSIHMLLAERLERALTDNLNDVEPGAAWGFVNVNYERSRPLVNGEPAPATQRAVAGFTLDLPDETENLRTVIDDFVDALREAPIEHVLKFEEPLLRQELVQYAEEIFALEMKLRRVLSVIYLHAYDDQPYNLLRDESVKPMNPATEEHMQKVVENEFFFLTFSQYVNLNQRPDVARLPILVELIRSKETYEALRAELGRLPVEDEDDAVFVAGLKARMEAIEAMRNCVAHNRRPSKKASDNYATARPQLSQALDDFLNRWSMAWEYEISRGEMYWDTEARQAVEQAMEGADWDEEAGTITINDPDEPRASHTFSTRGDLEDYLRDIAGVAFYASVPFDDGAAVFDCDEEGVVEGVLSDYEDRLAALFAEDGEDDEDDEED